jgi:hypothetical protein
MRHQVALVWARARRKLRRAEDDLKALRTPQPLEHTHKTLE